MPELPMTVLPATNIKPTFRDNLSTATDLQLDFNTSRLTDSLAIYQQDIYKNNLSSLPQFRYDTNPYSRDWSSGGVITRLGSGYLTGAGSHTTYLGMGDIASASVAFTMPTCPHDGIVLDPYCGTGTTCKIAYEMNLRSIGIDINGDYIKRARATTEAKPLSLF